MNSLTPLLFTSALSPRPIYRQLVESSTFFSEEEVEIALELYDSINKAGDSSGYYYLGACLTEANNATDEQAHHCSDRLAGFSIFGPTPQTISTFDLYWIVVDNDLRGAGIGRNILDKTEQLAYQCGARKLYAETSGRAQYAPTQHFYERNGYTLEGRLIDYYSEGDDKLIFGKSLLPAD